MNKREKIADTKLFVRVRNCLVNNDLEFVDQLDNLRVDDLLRTPNFGPSSMKKLTAFIGERGMSFQKGHYEKRIAWTWVPDK